MSSLIHDLIEKVFQDIDDSIDVSVPMCSNTILVVASFYSERRFGS